MYQHILLAADGSNNALRAATEASKIAKLAKDSHVTIVYVADFEKAKTENLHASSAESLYVERRQKLANIEAIFREAAVAYKLEILRGNPGPEIIKFANDKAVDLVVVGSRGLNSLQEMVLGSVSHKVMKHVNCPALVVK
ncbi:universal stress protein [Solibacillus sp. FSL H8-0538]|uniref:universal stress protein n=1 Tax=Solibacillus sp. FSL H8-0538 TaxID=2921400 RepID=UPI0030F86256